MHRIYSLQDPDHANHNNGNIFTITNCVDTNRNQNFRYDNLNRIRYAWSDGPIWGEQYTIDPWGNLTQIASYNNKPRFESPSQPVFVNNQLVGVGYDPVGNQTTTTDLWGLPHNYTYDPENQISTVDNAVYTYNGDGQRVVKNIGGTGTIYWYGADGSVLGESDLNGNLTAEYVFFGGRRLARTDNPTSTTGTSSLKYYLADHLGSTTMLADATFSTVLEDTDYYPYGVEIFPDPTNSNHYKFTGKERDAETGNDYFGARYYGSNVGRFMSSDPLGGHTEDPQTLNRYAYVRNNPLNLTDPTGLDFYLQCTDKNHTGCTQVQIDPKNKDKTWVQADKNKKAIVVTSDSIRQGQNTATVGQNGVVINGKGNGVYFDNPASHASDGNHNPITLGGNAQEGLGGFSFDVNGNCGGTCLAAGSFRFSGTPEQAEAALNAAGAWTYSITAGRVPGSSGFADGLNSTAFGHHPFSDQFRLGSGPSTHISVPWHYIPGFTHGVPPTENPGYTVPATGGFHVDSSVGGDHAACANIPGVSCN